MDETKLELDKIYYELSNSNVDNIKLYISCVRECPISGEIDLNFIIDEIEYYFNKYEGINELCLSDTCGTLNFLSHTSIIADKDSFCLCHKSCSDWLQFSQCVVILGLKVRVY